MFKKIIFLMAISVLIFSFSGQSNAAEGDNELKSDYVSRIQNEISSDISNLRKSIETELADFKLSDADISSRILELNSLSSSVSEDAVTLGFSIEEREEYDNLISNLLTSYTAYEAINQKTGEPLDSKKDDDDDELKRVASPDINFQDSLLTEINRVSRSLNASIFNIQSKINKLKLEIIEASLLRKELEEAQSGEKGLENPKIHALKLENSRLNIALSIIQVREQRVIFDNNVKQIQRLRGRLERIKGRLIFPEEVLNSNLEKIKSDINNLISRVKDTGKSLDNAKIASSRARASLGSADIKPLTNASSHYIARLSRVNYWEYMSLLLDDEIAFDREAMEIWQNRYKLFHDQADGDLIWQLREKSQTRIHELQRQLDGIRIIENRVFKNIHDYQDMMNSEDVSPQIRQYLTLAIDIQRKIIVDILNRYETVIPNNIFLQQRLYNEANENLSALRLAEKVSSFSYDTVMGFLNTQLWEGEGYSVTVSKLVIAVTVLLFSYFLSSFGSNILKRRILRRAKTSISAANAIQRIVFYILWIAFALIALNIVKIPLTAFAFMGGAIALGIGFGMQNIFNNLISGFIVIFSRSFKVNDIIEVAGNKGTVTDIGSRATTIKTWDGLDVVIPNRYFLENSAINWTGSDMKKRECLQVGVSYNSDSRKVEELLLNVVKGHSKVLKDPAPFVIFRDFGDSSLDFDVYFWIDLSQSSGPKVASDMRHHIFSVFNKEGIEIPFPQRDVHIIPTSDSNPDSTQDSDKNSDKDTGNKVENKDAKTA